MNKENLLGGSNQEALDKLRSSLSKASSSSVEAKGGRVELVVARRVHNPGSSMSPSMAALGEEPEEVGVRYLVLFAAKNSNHTKKPHPFLVRGAIATMHVMYLVTRTTLYVAQNMIKLSTNFNADGVV